MVTGCEPISVRFTGLLISNTAVEDSHDDPPGLATLRIFGRLDHKLVEPNSLTLKCNA